MGKCRFAPFSDYAPEICIFSIFAIMRFCHQLLLPPKNLGMIFFKIAISRMENPLELENVGEIQKKGGQPRIQRGKLK